MTNTVRSAAVRLTMENAAYIRGANQAAGATEQATGRMQRAVRNTAASTGRDWDTMGKYGGRFALAVGTGVAIAEKRIIGFDKTMSAATAATRASAREQEALRAAAIKAGADTAFTASEAAQAITEEGKAGISTANILKGGLRGALDLAAAGTIGVGEAAEYTATTLVQFKLGGEQARHVADLLAAGAGKAQGEVGDMALALSYVGVPAHAAKISLEETVGTIALLAKNGLIGEKAGTSLRGMLASLQSPSKIAADTMKNLGINVYDAQGRFKGFDGVAEELHKRLGGLTDQERQWALGKIFGNEQLQAANILYDEGARGVHKMTREVNDQGYATEVASKKLDNLAGDWERFTGSLESAFISAGSPAQEGLRELVQNGEDLVNAFASLPDEVQQGIVKVAVLSATIGGVLYAVSKIRNVSRDLRGMGTGKAAAGGLAGAASLAAPVPVFVVNMGAGGLGGVGGKGGTTVLGGGGASGAGGKVRGFALPRGTGIVATLGGLALMATGATDKTHTGSTVGGGLSGGAVFGVPGALIGSGLGALHDVYNSGNQAADALERAKKALASGTVKEQKAALADLRREAEKLANGGWGQNFARGVTELTGRRGEIEETGKALQDALDEKKYSGNMLWLLSGGTMGKRPKGRAPAPDRGPGPKDALDTLLDPNRGGRKRKPKQKTSEQVLADFFGVDVKKLKPVPVLDKVLDDDGLPTPGKKHLRSGIKELAVGLGLDTKGFDKKLRAAERSADGFDGRVISPKVDLIGTEATLGQLARIANEIKSIPRQWRTDYYVVQHNAIPKRGQVADAQASGNGADGATVPKTGLPYADRHLYMLADGEEIISNRHGQADRFRADRAAGRIPSYAGGGTTGAYSQSYQAGTSVTVMFPSPTYLAAAVQAADAVAAANARSARSQRDIRQENLDILHTQQQIRDLTKQLHERNKKGKLELRGLDRTVAKAELADLKASLKEIRDETRRAAAEELASRRKEATDQLTSAGDVFARGNSPASAVASVNKAIADISEYGQVMSQLRAAKASPALLQQLINRANTGDFRSAVRLGKALLAQPVTLAQLNTSLATLGTVSSSVATMTTDPRFLAGGVWNPTSTKVVQVNLGADPSAWLAEVRRVITFEVEAKMAAISR